MFFELNNSLVNMHNIETITMDRVKSKYEDKEEHQIVIAMSSGDKIIAYQGDYPYCRKMYSHLQDCLKLGVQQPMHRKELG